MICIHWDTRTKLWGSITRTQLKLYIALSNASDSGKHGKEQKSRTKILILITICVLRAPMPISQRRRHQISLASRSWIQFGEIVLSQEDVASSKLNEEISPMNRRMRLYRKPYQINRDCLRFGATSSSPRRLQEDGKEGHLVWQKMQPIWLRLTLFISIAWLYVEKDHDISVCINIKSEFWTEAWADYNVTALFGMTSFSLIASDSAVLIMPTMKVKRLYISMFQLEKGHRALVSTTP